MKRPYLSDSWRRRATTVAARVGIDADGIAGATGLPVLPPWVAVAELALFVAGVGLLEWLAPQFDLSSIQPNPCWLPVLLLSLQYGTVSGLLAASAAIGLTVVGGFPNQDVDENHFTYLLRIWGQPLLWVAAAVLLGQFRNRQITAKLDLGRRVSELESQRAAIASHADNLRQRCDALERRIAARPEPQIVGALSELATVAATAGAETLEIAFARTMQTVFPGATASMYRRDADGFVCVATSGYSTSASCALRIDPTSPLALAITTGNGSFSVMTRDGETKLAGTGMAAAPIQYSRTGEVIGFVRLDTVEPAQLGPKLAAALAPIAVAFAPLLAGDRQHAGTDPMADALDAAAQAGPRRGWRQMRWFSTPSRPAEPAALPAKTQASG